MTLQQRYPESFDDNGKCVSGKNVAVNKFNQYFVNVGVDLAKKIPVPNQNTSFHGCHGYMPKKNECNLFLSPVLEEYIITTVNTCKSKTSKPGLCPYTACCPAATRHI